MASISPVDRHFSTHAVVSTGSIPRQERSLGTLKENT